MRKQHVLVAVAAAVMSACGVTSHAAISVPLAGTTETFDVQPPAINWSTLSIPGATADANTDAGLDAKVVTIAPTSIVNQLASLTGTPAIVAEAKYFSDAKNVATPPTGNFANALMATLTNGAGGPATGLSLNYDLGLVNNNVTTADEIPGHRIYYNLTGNATDWKGVADKGFNGNVTTPPPAVQAQSVNMTFAGGTWLPNTTLYVLFLDDNGANPDGLFTLDNIKFTPTGVPEPTTIGLGAVGALGLLSRRGRRPA